MESDGVCHRWGLGVFTQHDSLEVGPRVHVNIHFIAELYSILFTC